MSPELLIEAIFGSLALLVLIAALFERDET